MCRWLAYSGSPVFIEEVLYKPEHSLIDQSLHSRMGAETTNGDGFGLGWYAPDANTPAVFHSIEPAWNDRNLREVASHHARCFPDAPCLHAHPEAGGAAPELHGEPYRLLLVLHRALSSLVSRLSLHAPLKRGWGGTVLPEWAMFGARKKMTRSGHAGQVDVKSRPRGGRAGPLRRPRRRAMRPPACPGRWPRGGGRCVR